MQQSKPNQKQGNLNLICWVVAAEPAILAVIAFFVQSSGAANVSLPAAMEEKLLVAFLAISSTFAWLSFRLASGGIPGRLKKPANHQGLRLAAVGLAAGPGVLGFVHYLFYGQPAALLFFNGGATALAVWHIIRSN